MKCFYDQSEGQTALHIAAADGDENIVKYLHMLHANPNISDNEGIFRWKIGREENICELNYIWMQTGRQC